MKKKDLSISKKNVVSEISLLQWAILAAVSLFLFIFPFQIALFNGFSFDFEGALLESMIYAFLLLLIVGIRFFSSWRLTDYRSLLSIFVLVLPFMYFLSYFNAVAVHNAKLMLQLELMMAAFFIIGLYITENKLNTLVVELSIQISGYVVVIYGLMNLLGQAYFPNALWLADTNGYRLTSVFQYSNSYAAFLAALFLGGLFSAVHTKQWYWRALHSFMLVPIWISFMLTYSRAALVFIPVLVLIILPFLRIGKQLSYLIYMFLAIVSSFAILSEITAISDSISKILEPSSGQGKTMSIWNHLPLSGWGLLLGASILVAAVITLTHDKLLKLLENRTAKLGRTKWSFVAVPAVFIIVGALAATLVFTSSGVRSLLPASIANRIETINFEQHSVLERETFYRDALKVSADYPLIGAGGGAWTVLYEKYQSNPYTSNQAHNFYLQTLIEIGWIGLILLLAFLVTVYYLFIRAYIKNPELRGSHFLFFIISISILSHSAIDFDMSYGFLAVLVFLSLGAMLGPFHTKLVITSFASYKDHKWRMIYPASLSILALIMFFWVYREYDANLSYRHSLEMAIVEKKPLNEILPPIDHAISISPDQPEYTLRKMNWMQQAFDTTHDVKYRQEYKRLLDQLKPFAPYNRSLILDEYRYFKDEGQTDKVLQTLDEGIAKFPWDMNFYEAAIMEYFLAGQNEKQKNSKDTDIKWDHSLELYQEVLNRIERLKLLPAGQLQGREFKVSPLMRQAIGQIYYFRKEYQQSINLLREDINGEFNDPNTRINVRFYLASLEALRQRDDNLYNKLIKADSNEQAALEQQYNSN
ncbi:O-antigen ligase family protein [Paenibacillus sp. sptzw28]|uniref:O-antigen ligase family protein n=1 Tax=Paenibacillus sp. sptzw28 TaxID=715179 RepID=UPI001C6E1B74|nr:O-antigen ligase family protein [Paenibacillus sp. sptzw28]QYR21220.1 O-antigen ligase family protein [Paenibacillus sp. sptzw28]